MKIRNKMNENQKRKISERKPTTTAMKMAKLEIPSSPQSMLGIVKNSARHQNLPQIYELQNIHDVKGEKTVEKRAWCLYLNGMFALDWKKFTKAESVFTEGIDLMKKTFGENAPTYRLFGYLHKSRIFALRGSAVHDESKLKLWEEVIDMFKQATDWESRDERFEKLEEAMKGLKECADKLGNKYLETFGRNCFDC